MDALVTQGANVTVLDDLSTGLKTNLNPRVTFYRDEVEDAEAIYSKLKNIDLVYHLAADATTKKAVWAGRPQSERWSATGSGR